MRSDGGSRHASESVVVRACSQVLAVLVLILVPVAGVRADLAPPVGPVAGGLCAVFGGLLLAAAAVGFGLWLVRRRPEQPGFPREPEASDD
jgi:hypothetical protein